MLKKGKRKRTRVLIVTLSDAPECVIAEFTRILKGLPVKRYCFADTVDFDDTDIASIEHAKPDWLLVYCPARGQDWICELLQWLSLHPQVHAHILYERVTQSSPPQSARKPTDPAQEPDYVLRDFCLQLMPQKRPN